MAANRIVLGAVVVGFLGLPTAVAQSPTSYPLLQSPGTGGMPMPAPPTSSGMGGMPGGLSSAGPGGSMSTLTAPPGLPPGSVGSPWVGGLPAGAQSSGQVGANGPATYELYARTGLNRVVGGGTMFAGGLDSGVNVTGGGRSLLLNPAGDAAWAIDVGVSFIFNRGANGNTYNVFTPQPTNQQGTPQGPDQLVPHFLRSMHRTSVNFAIGRDWFLNGPGFLGAQEGWNSRIGGDIGYRWGTAHVNLIPQPDTQNYYRRTGITNGVALGAHWTWDVPVGNWIWFTGIRAEYVFTMTNIVPPQDGNLQDVNILWTVGLRF